MVSVAVGISGCGWASENVVVPTSGIIGGCRSVVLGALPVLVAASFMLRGDTLRNQHLKAQTLGTTADTLRDVPKRTHFHERALSCSVEVPSSQEGQTFEEVYFSD